MVTTCVIWSPDEVGARFGSKKHSDRVVLRNAATAHRNIRIATTRSRLVAGP
jgi:hypothetical protein